MGRKLGMIILKKIGVRVRDNDRADKDISSPGSTWRGSTADGDVPCLVKADRAFEKVNGIILGTFTTMEKNHCVPDFITLVKEYAHPKTPIAVTKNIGHGDNAKAIFIGKEIDIKDRDCVWAL